MRRTLAILRKPNGELQIVGAIHESPEQGWIRTNPTTMRNPVGGGVLAYRLGRCF